MTDFFKTRIGKTFFDATMPRLVEALEMLSGKRRPTFHHAVTFFSYKDARYADGMTSIKYDPPRDIDARYADGMTSIKYDPPRDIEPGDEWQVVTVFDNRQDGYNIFWQREVR